MASRSGIDSQITNRLGADQQLLFFAVKAQFDTETIRLWTGIDDITLDGETYTGAGDLLGITDIEDTLEIKSTNCSFTLSGMDETVLNLALSEDIQNRKIFLFMGYLSGGGNVSAGEITLFSGRMTNLSINDDPDGMTIIVNAENRLVDLNRPCNLRYTLASQQIINSTDTGFKYVMALQDKQIDWGRPSNDDTSNSGGGTSNEDQVQTIRR
jgi:hypothetical protein|tara:strand:+ start:1074 stop:1709 length:636 start_codon:yes stop_codon:yes gene_type:complete